MIPLFRLLVLLAIVAGVSVVTEHQAWAQDSSARDRAKEEAATDHYERGERALERKSFEMALAWFSKSHALSKRVATRLRVVESLIGLRQHARAYNVAGLIEAEPGADPAIAGRARELRTECAAKIAVLSVVLVGEPASARVTIGDVDVPLGSGVGVEPGAVSVKLLSRQSGETKDTLHLVREVEATAGTEEVIELTMPPPTAKKVAGKPREPPEEIVMDHALATASDPTPKSNGLIEAAAVLIPGGLMSFAGAPVCYTNEDDSKHEPCLYASLILGGALTAIGLPLLIGGIAVQNAEKSRQPYQWQAHVAPTPGGAFVRVGRQF